MKTQTFSSRALLIVLLLSPFSSVHAQSSLRANKSGNTTISTDQQLNVTLTDDNGATGTPTTVTAEDGTLSTGEDVVPGISILEEEAGMFQTCNAPNKQLGVVPDDSILDPFSQCYRSIQAPLQLFRAMVEADLFGDLASNEIVTSMMDIVFKPFEEILIAIEKALGFEGIVCAGDFDAVEVIQPADQDDMIDTCKGMPFSLDNDPEWSIFAGHTTLSPEKAALVCQIPSSVTFSFCMAASRCDSLPSVAFTMDSGLASCILNQLGRAAALTGVGAAATAIIAVLTTIFELGFQDAGLGFSMSNSFQIEMPVFSGEDFFWHKARPSMFSKMSFAIESATIHPALDGFFSLGCDGIQGVNVLMPNGEPLSEVLFAKAFEGFNANNLAEQFDGFQVQTVLQGTIQMKMNFHSIPFIGTLFPDFNFEFARANAFLSTGKHDLPISFGRTRSVYPGMSVFVGQSGNEKILAETVKTIVKSLDGIIDSLIPRMPLVDVFTNGQSLGDLVADFLLDHLAFGVPDTDEKSYGMAVTMNVEYVGFLFLIPIMVGESLLEPVADFMLRCVSDYEKFTCEVKFDNVSTIVTAIAKEIEGGFMWIWKEADEFFKFEETAEIIGEAFERAGDQAQQVFSRENVVQTLKDIVEGNLKVDEEFQEIASIGYAALSAFCNDEEGCKADGTTCFGDPLGQKKKQGTCCDCCNDDTDWLGATSNGLPGRACGSEPRWADGTLCLKGLTCHLCENSSSDWLTLPALGGLPGHACGHEPCWGDGHVCVDGISCHKCCSDNNMSFKCGKEGCWGDGTPCLWGTCKNCCSDSNSWWNSKFTNACGHQ